MAYFKRCFEPVDLPAAMTCKFFYFHKLLVLSCFQGRVDHLRVTNIIDDQKTCEITNDRALILRSGPIRV
jgi:hypothetical protein